MRPLQINQPIAFQATIKALARAKGFAPPLAPVPQETAEPTSHKMVCVPEHRARIAVVEVIAPSSKDEVHLPNDFRQRFLISAVCQLPNLIPQSTYSLLGGHNVQIPPPPPLQILVVTQSKSQEVQTFLRALHSDNARLVSVHTKSKVPFKLGLDPIPYACSHMPGHHHEIIRIANQSRVGNPFGAGLILVEDAIEFVKVDIGQKRRDDSMNAKGNFEFMRRLPFRGKRD